MRDLLGYLVEKMRRTLSARRIDFRERRIVDGTMHGRIEWDESQAGHLPLVVVDGTEVSWKDLRANADGHGRMAVPARYR